MLTDASRVTGRTALLAILDDPVEQARTPGLVNAELTRRGCDAVLVPLHVAAAGLPPALAGLRAARNFRGCVVSMPHKMAATGRGDLVAEVVIRAESTPLLAQAAARGCTVQPGLPMLVAQIEMMVDFMLVESLGD